MSLYRIMLVDDEEEVRKGIIRKIEWEKLGFQVVGDAENGQDALEKIELLEPDVVMTDIRMPYMDGLTLSARIRQKYPSIKILIFSGYDDFEYAQQAIKLSVYRSGYRYRSSDRTGYQKVCCKEITLLKINTAAGQIGSQLCLRDLV